MVGGNVSVIKPEKLKEVKEILAESMEHYN